MKSVIVDNDFPIPLSGKPINKAEITRAFTQFLPEIQAVENSAPPPEGSTPGQAFTSSTHTLGTTVETNHKNGLYPDVPTHQFQQLLKELFVIRDGSHRQAINGGMITDIEQLALELEPLGKKFCHEPLVIFGDKLSHYVNIFDVGKIETLLPTFDRIISDIEAIIKQREKENVE